MRRTTLIICLAAIMLLALAVPAFANPDGSSGTVYGKAVLAPYAIVISGGGTDPGSPLTYQGNLGQWAQEMYGQQVTVQNVGTLDAQLRITADQLPTDGYQWWGLSAWGSGSDMATWAFDGPTGGIVLPPYDPSYYAYSTMDDNLSAGSSASFTSRFQFPYFTSSTGDHYMSATISAVPAIN